MNQKAAGRAAWLRQQIERANHAYYVLDTPEIPDAEYDRYFRELQELERGQPDLRTPDSPTQRVGAAVAGALVKHTHRRPMLSLANAFTTEELDAWEDRNARILPEVRDAGYTAEIKIDGAAVSLTYEEGRLTVGATRGNGVIGENITANIRTIADVPLALKGRGWPALLEIRGEVYMPYAGFQKVNEERGAPGRAALRQPAQRRGRRPPAARSRAHPTAPAPHLRVRDRADRGPDQGDDPLRRCSICSTAWGFQVEPQPAALRHAGRGTGPDHQLRGADSEALPFQADGVVVKVDRLALHGELGVVGGREPRWAIARKFAPDVAITRVLRHPGQRGPDRRAQSLRRRSSRWRSAA